MHVFLGSTVADAAARPLHWVYNQKKLLNYIRGKKDFTFLKINKSPFIQNKNNLQNNLLATKIIYSSKQITINKKIIKFFKEYCNPNNFSELPNERDIIKVNEPICLLHLMAKTKKLLEKKLNIETDNFLTKIEKNL